MRLMQVRLDFSQDVWERKVGEGCTEKCFCSRESFTFPFTLKDVTNAWHRDRRERKLPHWEVIYMHGQLFEYDVED